MDKGVFWAVLAALGVFLGVLVLGSIVKQRQVEAAQQQAWAGVLEAANNPDPMGFRAEAAKRAEEQRREDHEQAADAWRRRQLADNQRCIGGVIVEISGSTYTQLGSISNPVRCAGRYADRAIR